MRLHLISSIVVLLVQGIAPDALIPCAHANDEYEYAVFVGKGLGELQTVAWSVNNKGVLIGHSFPESQSYQPWAWSGKYSLNLGTLGGGEGEAWDVNNNGTVVGWTLNDLGDRRAFVWTIGGGMIDLGTFGGESAVAYGINEHGDVVGVASLSGGVNGHGFLWNGIEKIDLGSLDNSLRSTAHDINDNGIVVGESDNASGIQRPVMWKDNGIIDLGSLGGNGNQDTAWAINDSEQVVGYSFNGTFYEPFLWENGAMRSISPSGGLAYDINNRGQVVGGKTKGGFVWDESTGARLLANLVPPKTGIEIEYATGISDSGMISAWGPDPESCGICKRAYMLVPVQPQITLSDPSPGVAGEVNTWTVTGARPGASITFAYSLKGGGTCVPGCDLNQAVLQLDDPVVMGNAIADANGVAKLQMFVPAKARNAGDVLFQSVRFAGCAESQLVVYNFQ